MTTATTARAAQLPQLTTLRFFAAFWVLGFHALPRSGAENAWAAFWSVGWMGVTFFFVLSGFILTYTYGGTRHPLDRRAFWVARFARVYPLYVVALLFAVPQLVHDVRLASTTVSPLGTGQLAGVVITSTAMVQAWFARYVCLWNCPTWSLSAEAFYYALFPLALLLTASRPRRTVLLVLAGCGMGLILMGAADAAGPSFAVRAAEASVNPLVRLPEFLLGCWLGAFFLARRPSWRASSLIAAVAGLAIVALAIWAGEHRSFTAPHLIAAPLFALLILAVAATPDPDRGILAVAPLVLLGEASYALYLLHGPLHGYALAAFNRVAPGTPDAAKFVVYAVAAIGLSIVSFQRLEQPMRAWLRERLGRRT